MTVHGRAELFDVLDPDRTELKQAMLDYYLPKQGLAFQIWLEDVNPLGARIAPDKILTFALPT